MLKRIGLAGLILGIILIFIAITAFLIDRLQRIYDRRVLISSVGSNTYLQHLKRQRAIEKQVICKPSGSDATYCPALLYKMNEDECFELQNKLGVEKKWCGHKVHLDSNERNIEVRLGQVYEQPDGNIYVAIVMNERNLLSF